MNDRQQHLEALQRLLEHNCTPNLGDLFRVSLVLHGARAMGIANQRCR